MYCFKFLIDLFHCYFMNSTYSKWCVDQYFMWRLLCTCVWIKRYEMTHFSAMTVKIADLLQSNVTKSLKYMIDDRSSLGRILHPLFLFWTPFFEQYIIQNFKRTTFSVPPPPPTQQLFWVQLRNSHKLI